VHEFVKRKERNLVKNVLPNLELVRIPDPDAHLPEALIELIQFFVYLSSGTHGQVTIVCAHRI